MKFQGIIQLENNPARIENMWRKELEGNLGKVEESQGKVDGKVSNQFILLNNNNFVQDT